MLDIDLPLWTIKGILCFFLLLRNQLRIDQHSFGPFSFLLIFNVYSMH